MAQFQKSALIKKKEDVLFVTNSKGSFSSSLLRKVEEQLNNSDVSRVVFYFDEKSEHEKSMIEDICSLLVCYPDLEAKVFRRKNILFLQRPLFEKERLIRFPQGKIISKPGKFIYEGMLFKPKSRLYETILNTIIVDQPRVVQFSIPVRKSEETNEEFLRHTADIRFLLLKELQEENAIRDIQFFIYRHSKKELVDAYTRYENFEIKRSFILSNSLQNVKSSEKRSVPLHISKYQQKLLARQEELRQAVNGG